MALPTYDASSENTPAAAVSSSTHSHTFAASAAAVVNVRIRDATTAPTVSTVTVGGNSASFVNGDTNFGDRRVEQWVCPNPPTGAQDVIVTLSGSTSVGLNVGCLSYTGCHATTPAGASLTNESVSNDVTPTVTFSTTYTDSLVVDCAYHTDDATYSASGAGQTQRENRIFISGNDVVGSSQKSAATAGSYTMEWTAGTSGAWVTSAMELRSPASESIGTGMGGRISKVPLRPRIFAPGHAR